LRGICQMRQQRNNSVSFSGCPGRKIVHCREK
jgi:hypothetical protein